MLPDLKTNIENYTHGKSWGWYVSLWLFGAYLFVKLIGFAYDKPLPLPLQIAQSFDFMLHEMAHIALAWAPAIATAAAGSLSEILLGAGLIITAFKTRGYFAALFCGLWFMLACQSAGAYMADARAQKMDLVSLGGALSGSDTATHDWHFVFGQLHILGLDTLIGGFVRLVGIAVGLASLAFAAWLIYKMAISKSSPIR